MTNPEPISTSPVNYCYVHPNRETSLCCRRCERPICASCAQHTPTGYLCKECVNQHRKTFDTAVWSDYLIVFFASAILSGLGAVATILITSIVWGFFIIGLAPIAGTLIGNGVRRLVKNRRSSSLNYTLAAGIIVGAVPVLLVSGLPALLVMVAGGGNALGAISSFGPLLWQVVYLVLAVPTAYYQFSGLVFRR
jgi:hypothetical protein